MFCCNMYSLPAWLFSFFFFFFFLLLQGRRQDFQKGGSALSIEFRRCAHVNTCTRVNMCILINSFAIASRGT